MDSWKKRHKNIEKEKKCRGEVYSFIADQIEGLIDIEIGNYLYVFSSNYPLITPSNLAMTSFGVCPSNSYFDFSYSGILNKSQSFIS